MCSIPYFLLALLLEEARDVQRKAVQIDTIAALRRLAHDVRTERVDLELRGLLRTVGLQMQVIQPERHEVSSR